MIFPETRGIPAFIVPWYLLGATFFMFIWYQFFRDPSNYEGAQFFYDINTFLVEPRGELFLPKAFLWVSLLFLLRVELYYQLQWVAVSITIAEAGLGTVQVYEKFRNMAANRNKISISLKLRCWAWFNSKRFYQFNSQWFCLEKSIPSREMFSWSLDCLVSEIGPMLRRCHTHSITLFHHCIVYKLFSSLFSIRRQFTVFNIFHCFQQY